MHDVVFPCGHTIGPDGDTLNIYYGAGDSCIALAQASMRSLLNWLDVTAKSTMQIAISSRMVARAQSVGCLRFQQYLRAKRTLVLMRGI